MTSLGSVVLRIAHQHEVPAGEALGVDRQAFGEALTGEISEHPNIVVHLEPYTVEKLQADLAEGTPVILATGPLTSDDLAAFLAEQTERKHLYFYDAVSPTVLAASLNRDIIFAQSRYGKGEGDDYLNCPFEKDHYLAFVEALVNAEKAPIHAFEAGGKRDGTPGESQESTYLEKIKYFAGCTPIEAIAAGGPRSLAFGNFKPVGLEDPRTGRRPYAALQLRPENKEKSLYSLVACQTRLKWGEQKRIFQMVPGLENAEFVRYGVIHRNTYLDAPAVLSPELELKSVQNLFVSGQLTGVEGYVESAAMGIFTGIAVLHRLCGKATPIPDKSCAFGALLGHLQDDTAREFAPMNINWGLLPTPEESPRDKGVRRTMQLENAAKGFLSWLAALDSSLGS